MPRSLAQIVYETTGCIMPRDMHRYDSIVEELIRYGLQGQQCSLILADEPTGSLDHSNAFQVMEILKSFADMGKTVIMVTHAPTLIDDSMRQIRLGAETA